MRKALVLVFFATFCTLFLGSTPQILAQSAYPQDLRIEAISGGPAPWERLEKIDIVSTGHATYWLMTDRAKGEWILDSTFMVSENNMTKIWNIIQTRDFFSLATNYTDPQWVDGSYCIINVTANGLAHSVITQNIEVPEFDAIATIINDVTPGDLDLFYNAIHPDWNPPSTPTMAETTSEMKTPLPPSSMFICVILVCGGLPLSLQTKRILKANRRSLSCSLSVCAVFLLIAMFTVNSVAAETEVKATACNVTITMNLEFFGPGTTRNLVEEFKKGIEDVWGRGDKWCGLCSVNFVVNTVISVNGGTRADYHQIEVVRNGVTRSRWTATVARFDPSSGKTNVGRGWFSDEHDPDRPSGNRAAHEIGHLALGRRDTYRDVPGGASEPKDRDHEDDIMARTWDSPKPHKEHIEGIVRDSGQIPPPFAKANPKTITIPIPLGPYGSNSKSFSTTVSNPTDNDITVEYDWAWVGLVPEDTYVTVWTAPYPKVAKHSSQIFEAPLISVGPNAKPGLYEIRITWTAKETGYKFDTDPYVELTKAVGGIGLPVDKFSLLAPYIYLASTILAATVATTIYAKRKSKHEKEATRSN